MPWKPRPKPKPVALIMIYSHYANHRIEPKKVVRPNCFVHARIAIREIGEIRGQNVAQTASTFVVQALACQEFPPLTVEQAET